MFKMQNKRIRECNSETVVAGKRLFRSQFNRILCEKDEVLGLKARLTPAFQISICTLPYSRFCGLQEHISCHSRFVGPAPTIFPHKNAFLRQHYLRCQQDGTIGLTSVLASLYGVNVLGTASMIMCLLLHIRTRRSSWATSFGSNFVQSSPITVPTGNQLMGVMVNV